MHIYLYSIYKLKICPLHKIFRKAYKVSKNRALSLSVLTVRYHRLCSTQTSSPEQSSYPINHMLNNVRKTTALEAGHIS